MVAVAILAAARKTNMPEGVFSLLHGNSFEPGKLLVLHPHAKAVGFTGSFQGGKALFDLANTRENPIPVFAEMGSTNPVFILGKALEKRPGQLATQLAGSVNLGVGQFCTKPGIIVLKEGPGMTEFLDALASEFLKTGASSMLNERIAAGFMNSVSEIEKHTSVNILGTGQAGGNKLAGKAVIAAVPVSEFEKNPRLHQEVFGPFSLVIICPTEEKMLEVAKQMEGQLTLTLMAGEGELSEHAGLVAALREKAGRLIHNGVPTGVEVCPSMQHGGPFPATTDSRFSSVGTSAIKRFARPVAWQNWPEEDLPPELQSSNPLNIWRLIDNVWTRENVG
jgi:NADP-dependent aldehyde dehydrogenase